MDAHHAQRSSLRRGEIVAISAVVVLAVSVRLVLLDRPFARDPEGCGAYFGILARNYLRRPLAETLGVPVQNLGLTNPPRFYSHHPPLVPAAIAATYAVCGFRGEAKHPPPNWQTRLSTSACTVGSAVMLYVLLRRRASARAGILAAAVFTAVPITVRFGGMPEVVGPQMLLFVLTTLAAYDRFHKSPSFGTLLFTLCSFALALWSDWPAAYLMIVLVAHFAFTKPLRQWPWIALLSFGAVVLFFIAYAQLAVAENNWLWISKRLAVRTMGAAEGETDPLTWSKWFAGAIRTDCVALHTLPVLILAALWLLVPVARSPNARAASRIAAVLLAWGTIHVIVGRQGVYSHEWWWWPMVPGICVAAALALDRAADYFGASGRSRIAVGLALVLFICGLAAWSAVKARSVLYHPDVSPDDPNGFTITEIGDVIRAVVPPDTAVALTDTDFGDPGLWYYADRPIIQEIWHFDTLQQRLSDPQTADLPFRFTEPWTRPPTRMIVPKSYLRFDGVPQMVEKLRVHYPELQTTASPANKFFIFDLTARR